MRRPDRLQSGVVGPLNLLDVSLGRVSPKIFAEVK